MRPREIVGLGLLMAFCIAADLFLVLSPIKMAYADEPTPNTKEMAFLERMAQETNQTPNELVVNVAVTTAVTSGKQVAKSGTNGITRTNTLSQNLSNFKLPKGTVEFKEWDTLDEIIKSQWGSKDNYHAAMFNMMMGTGYGTKDLHDGFIGYSGDNWENPDTTLTRRLSEVFAHFNDDTGNTVEQLMDIVKGGTDWYQNFIGNSSYLDGTDVPGWPSFLSINAHYSYTTQIEWKSRTNSNAEYGTDTLKTNIPCWWMILVRDVDGTPAYSVLVFNTTPFTYQQGTDNNLSDFNSIAKNGTYIQFTSYHMTSVYEKVGFPVFMPTTVTTRLGETEMFAIANAMLGNNVSTDTSLPAVEDYPSDIQQDLNVTVKVPTEGVTPDVNWNKFVVNSGGESGGESETDLSDIIQLLQNIWGKVTNMTFDNGDLKVYDNRVYLTLDAIYTLLDSWFDRWSAPDVGEIVGNLDFPEFKSKIDDLVPDLKGLIPFGAIFFYQELFDFIALAGPVDEPVFTFDFNFIPDNPQTIEIDLGFLDDALVLFRFFSIALLCISLVKLTMKFVVSEVV